MEANDKDGKEGYVDLSHLVFGKKKASTELHTETSHVMMDPEEGPQKLFPSAAFNIRVIHSPFHSYTWPHQSFCLMTISS